MTEITRTPDMIAGEILTIKNQVMHTAVMACVEIGRRLKEAKGLVPEGQWQAWLAGRVAYSVRTAQNMMALAAEFDAGQGKALENLSYTKAVLMLGVPRYEREQFAQEHDIDSMSTRELKATIADLQDALEGKQMDMQDMISDQDAEELRKLSRERDKLQGQVDELKLAVSNGKKSGEAFAKEIKILKDKLADARAGNTKAELQAAEEKKKLEEELAAAREALQATKAPMIQQVTPPEVEEELARLRAQVKRGAEDQAVRGAYDMLKQAYDVLIQRLKAMDADDAAKYRAAFGKALRMMADSVEGA